jgi:acetylornithine deacetylase/succinyl-diaminopimelate desuccinylase-like protein
MQKIFDYIASNRERFQNELAALIKQPSNSTTGEGLEACAAVLQNLMQNSGIDTRILPTDGAPVVYGETSKVQNGQTVLIYGHYDVKAPEPLDAWTSPPYQPQIRDGRIYGRGSADNKGQMYAHVKAVESILAVEKQLPVNVKFIFEGEEEIASPNLTAFVLKNKLLLDADLMYSSDGTLHFDRRPAVLFGVRGILKVEIGCRGASQDVHSGNFGGLVPNQTPEKVLQKLKAHVDNMSHLGDFTMTLKTHMLPFRTPLDHPYAQAVIDAVGQGFAQEPVLIPSMGWSDPTHVFGNILGLPCFKVPYAQPDSNFHAPNENLLLDIYDKSIKTTTALLFALAQKGDRRKG